MILNPDLAHRKNPSGNLKSESAPDSAPNWWTPLWKGLLVEPSAKHYEAMGSAVWLYLYLLVYANRLSGMLFRRTATIAKDMGLSCRTISRWLKILKVGQYIETRRTGHALQISITKWKPIKKR